MKDLIDHVKANCTEIDREARFDQMLDECYDFSNVGGPFAYMVPSQVLKEMDPTAYRCGVNDYMDGEDTYEIDGETYDQKEVEEARDEFVSDLETGLSCLEEELSELEDDLTDLESEEDSTELEISRVMGSIAQAKKNISDREEDIDKAQSYQF